MKILNYKQKEKEREEEEEERDGGKRKGLKPIPEDGKTVLAQK